MGTIRFLLLMMSVCVLVGTAANFLREPTYNLIDENFGLHLHPAPDGPPPPTPGPMIMN